MTDPRDLIQRLADALFDATWDFYDIGEPIPLVSEARAYLAATPEPAAGPTNEKLISTYQAAYQPAWDQGEYHGCHVDGLRAVLAHYGNHTPAPIPLSERQPTEADYTTDGEAWYWDSICGCWFFLPGPPLNNHYTHWLPHWALPVPEQEVSQ